MHLTGKNGQATKKTDKMNKSPATASDSQKAGGAKMEKKSSDDAEAEKKPRQRVRTSRWSKETESRGPQSAQVMEKIQQLQKKWERAPERQREQRGQRTGCVFYSLQFNYYFSVILYYLTMFQKPNFHFNILYKYFKYLFIIYVYLFI